MGWPNPITTDRLPEGHLEKPYNPAGDKGYCDLCNWYGNFEDNEQIWLCDEHARELGKLW